MHRLTVNALYFNNLGKIQKFLADFRIRIVQSYFESPNLSRASVFNKGPNEENTQDMYCSRIKMLRNYIGYCSFSMCNCLVYVLAWMKC